MTEASIVRLAQAHAWRRPGLRRVRHAARAAREGYCMATATQRVLPDLVVAGVQRSGTTALSEALHRLPMVRRPRRGKGSHYFSLNHHRGWRWFRSQFPTQRAAEATRRRTGWDMVVFDACPYYLFHPLAVERMARDLPHVKILVMLRDPVVRAESHYHHSVANGHETLGFREALAAEPGRLVGEAARLRREPGYVSLAHEHHSYVAKGRYVDQLRRLFAHYRRDQVLVVASEAFYRDPDVVLGRVTSWLGLPDVSLEPCDDRNSHAYVVDAAMRDHLARVFAQPNEALFSLLGERFEWTAPR